jgi:hypothetical protein
MDMTGQRKGATATQFPFVIAARYCTRCGKLCLWIPMERDGELRLEVVADGVSGCCRTQTMVLLTPAQRDTDPQLPASLPVNGTARAVSTARSEPE